MVLNLLSGGAAHGLVSAVTSAFEAATGDTIEGTYGAVGALEEKLAAGAPADVVILTQKMVAALAAQGLVVSGSAVDIGAVHAAIAVRTGDPVPPIGDAPSLKATLEAADAIYFPDPEKATAGIHFARVLKRMGVADQLRGKLRTFPNGAMAMAALAAHVGGRPIGSTQATEIIGRPGIALAGRLPHEFELATIYTAAVTTRAASPENAGRLLAVLTSLEAAAVRKACGFEP